MKRLLFLLVIALLYCNGINSQSKNGNYSAIGHEKPSNPE